MNTSSLGFAACSVLLLIACDNGSTADGSGGSGAASTTGTHSTPTATGSGSTGTGLPEHGQLLEGDYTIEAGAEEYVCFTYDSPPTNEAIVAIQPLVDSKIHHTVLFRTTSPEPAGPFVCNTLGKSNWELVWGGGAGTGGLVMPSGVGMKVPATSQYLVQYHLLNPTASPVSIHGAVSIEYSDTPESLIPAGLFALSTTNFQLAPQATQSASIACNADRDMTVFAVFPHMHKLGTSLTFDKGASQAQAANAYTIDPWPFNEQPMSKLDLTVAQGDYLRLTCNWNNTTTQPVVFGESTYNEMCGFVLFYYPFTEFAGCFE